MRIDKLRKLMRRAYQRCQDEMHEGIDRTNPFSSGLSSEGYLGGYLQALRDVGLVSNDVMPNYHRTSQYWTEDAAE